MESLFHSSLAPYTVGKVELNKTVTLRVRGSMDLNIANIFLRTVPEGEEVITKARKLKLEEINNIKGWGKGKAQWWEAKIKLTTPQLNYRFVAVTNLGNFCLNAMGVSRFTPTDNFDFKLTVTDKQPSWVPESVFYQIFPDRFYNKDPKLSVVTGEYNVDGKPVIARKWHEDPQIETCNREFYGGDLYGIIEKLPYLKDLGVNALYLNPIFTAPSNHKYDVADYYQVDKHLGGNEALVEIRKALDKLGMKLVLDIVPNHCGNENTWFKKAQKDKNCDEYAFFSFAEHPHNYESWLGIHTLPRLNYKCELLKERMYKGRDAIFRRWIKAPYFIDGWRLDVANMLAKRGTEQLGHKIGRALRKAIKEENNQCWILGEHFFDGTSHLQGDELDSSMNYRGFTFPVLQWLAGQDFPAMQGKDNGDKGKLPTEDLAMQLNLFRAAIPESVSLCQMNLLGSHDTSRILTVMGNNVKKVQLAQALLFAYQGVPCIFYGDEVGLTGGKDPYCRKPMIWEEDKQNLDMHNYVQKLIKIRTNSSALKYGSIQILTASKDTIAFLRESEDEYAIFVANRQEECNLQIKEQNTEKYLDLKNTCLPEGQVFTDAISGKTAQINNNLLEIMPLGCLKWGIWISQKA